MFSNIGVCGIFVINLLVFVVRVSTVPVDTPTSTPSSKSSVREAKAQEMLKYMNASVDPCEDFYEFTCGNWNKYHSAVAKGQPTTGLLENLQTDLQEKLKLLLASDEPNDTDVDKKVKYFYRSCLNLPSLQTVYSDKLKEIVNEFGEMPALAEEAWQEKDFDWLTTVAAIGYKYGISVLTEVAVLVDIADQSVNRVYITEPTFALEDKSIYLNKANAQYVKLYAQNIALNLYMFVNLSPAVAVKIANEIVDFETALVKGTTPTNRQKGIMDMYTLTSFEELSKNYAKDLDLVKLVNLTLGSVPPLKVYVNHDYLENLARVVKETPPRIMANYIFYQFISQFMLKAPNTEEELQDTCIGHMKTHFSKNFDNMIYRKYNTRETERGVNEMWQHIKSAFKVSLESDHYPWINKETRKYAVEKLNAMQMQIISYEDHDFATAFQQFQVDSKDYIGNLKSLLQVDAAHNRAQIAAPPQPIDFSEQLSTTPSNVLIENAVKVPVALLQPNYAWSASYANAFNFGMLGALLSHELLHGFDDTGRNYDAQGNSVKWWDSASTSDFNTRAKCFNDQYQLFMFDGKSLPDMPSQSENIADNGGVRLAYEAYMKWFNSALSKDARVGDLERMPGLNFDNRKLFFISYGQLWCGDIHPNYRQYQASTDGHVPDKFRINGPLSNFKEFSVEFNCPKGSGMNPERKCEIY